MRHVSLIISLLLMCLISAVSFAQQTNPVERQVANPITDTPNVNPTSAEQKATVPNPKKSPSLEAEGGQGEVVVYSDKMAVEGEEGKRIVTHQGNVDARYGLY